MQPRLHMPGETGRTHRGLEDGVTDPDFRRAMELFDKAIDKIGGLEEDLKSAIRVAYNHGAHEWVRLNYPTMFERLSVENSNGNRE